VQEQGSRRAIGSGLKNEGDYMIIPIRCFTCGKLIGDKWEEFIKRVKNGEPAGKVLDDLGIKRYCCRRMLLSHVEIIDDLIKFYGKRDVKNENRR